MSIPTRLSGYLSEHGTHYAVRAHPHSHSSAETARLANVRPHQLAKSVILEDEQGPVMAVLPADQQVQVGRLSQMLGRRKLHLSNEDSIAALFADCELGAVPPLGMPWGVPTIVDTELDTSEVVCLEGGDHESVLVVSNAQFRELMREARRGHFCKARAH
jgi:Ala-tRNA(Pro) deacylase